MAVVVSAGIGGCNELGQGAASIVGKLGKESLSLDVS